MIRGRRVDRCRPHRSRPAQWSLAAVRRSGLAPGAGRRPRFGLDSGCGVGFAFGVGSASAPASGRSGSAVGQGADWPSVRAHQGLAGRRRWALASPAEQWWRFGLVLVPQRRGHLHHPLRLALAADSAVAVAVARSRSRPARGRRGRLRSSDHSGAPAGGFLGLVAAGALAVAPRTPVSPPSRTGVVWSACTIGASHHGVVHTSSRSTSIRRSNPPNSRRRESIATRSRPSGVVYSRRTHTRAAPAITARARAAGSVPSTAPGHRQRPSGPRRGLHAARPGRPGPGPTRGRGSAPVPSPTGPGHRCRAGPGR